MAEVAAWSAMKIVVSDTLPHFLDLDAPTLPAYKHMDRDERTLWACSASIAVCGTGTGRARGTGLGTVRTRRGRTTCEATTLRMPGGGRAGHDQCAFLNAPMRPASQISRLTLDDGDRYRAGCEPGTPCGRIS